MNMRIAVCDDNADDRGALLSLVEELRAPGDTVSAYASGTELTAAYKKGARYDLIFLDIQMEGPDGYTTAEQLHTCYRNEQPLIVFVTITDKYVFRGYDIRAFGYFPKPVNRERLSEKLEQARGEISRDAIIVHENGRDIIVSLKDIQYIMSAGNQVLGFATTGEFSIRSTLEEVMNKLPRRVFFQTHRSHIVNLAHIDRYDERCVYFKQFGKVSISRNRRHEFLAALEQYLRG
jgi:DNA-binding LytR/AlgR family response regulator